MRRSLQSPSISASVAPRSDPPLRSRRSRPCCCPGFFGFSPSLLPGLSLFGPSRRSRGPKRRNAAQTKMRFSPLAPSSDSERSPARARRKTNPNDRSRSSRLRVREMARFRGTNCLCGCLCLVLDRGGSRGSRLFRSGRGLCPCQKSDSSCLGLSRLENFSLGCRLSCLLCLSRPSRAVSARLRCGTRAHTPTFFHPCRLSRLRSPFANPCCRQGHTKRSAGRTENAGRNRLAAASSRRGTGTQTARMTLSGRKRHAKEGKQKGRNAGG